MTAVLTLKMEGSDKVRAALAKLTGKQIDDACRLAVRDAGYQARRVLQEEMRRVFDRPTAFIMKSVQVEIDPVKLSAVIEPTYFGGNGVDPQKILQAQEFGGKRALKRFERVLQTTGNMPAGWYAVPGKGANLDSNGNISSGQLMQILSQLRAQTTAGYTRNMAMGKRGIAAQRRAGGRFFVVQPGGKAMPGVYQREFMGRTVTPVLIYVRSTGYTPRLGMERIARASGLQEYFDKRVRYRLYQASEALR